MQEAGDEPLFCERAAGIDIGKAEVMVTIRVPSEARKGGRQQETRKFGTTRRELLALAHLPARLVQDLRDADLQRVVSEGTNFRSVQRRRCLGHFAAQSTRSRVGPRAANGAR